MPEERAYRDASETVATSPFLRARALDVMRAVAILLILGCRSLPPPADMSDFVRKPIQLLRFSGWVGVEVFLVLSGFLCAGILFRNRMQSGRMHISRFLVRRGLRLYPGLCVLVLVTAVTRTALEEAPALRGIFGELLFMQNYVGALWGHTWLLAVIAHFYLLLPILLFIATLGSRDSVNPFRTVPLFVLAICIVELAARIYMNLAYDYTPGSHKLVSHLRLDTLFFGVLLSYYYHYHNVAFTRFFNRWFLPLLIPGCLMLAPMLLLQHDHFVVSTFGFVLVYMIIGVVLGKLLVSNFPRNRLTGTLGYIGLCGYSIFLWHWAVIDWFMHPMDHLQVPWLIYTPAYMVVNILVGIMLAKIIEFPVLRWRDRCVPAFSAPFRKCGESVAE